MGLDEDVKSGVENTFIVLSNVDIIDIPFLIKNETKVPVGPPLEESIYFKHVQILKSKSSSHFVIADSEGYLTTLVKNLRLKSRIYSTSNDIV